MLRLTNIRKAYNGNVAVDGLSLEVRKGEIFGLLGPNGAGKTTTVSMAVGLLAPDSGEIALDGGSSPMNPAVRRRIGIAPQALAIYEMLTGEENLTFFGKIEGLSGQTLKDRVKTSLEFVGLYDRRRDRAEAYSGGMKRRLNIAAALVHDPDLILLDEPTVGVDPQSRNAIFEKIEALRDAGKTVVYTTHYMEEAQRLCNRVGVVDHGKLLALDTVPALIRQHGGARIVTAHTSNGDVELQTDNPLAELNRLAATAEVRTFSVNEPNLETVFLNLTGRHLRDE